MKNLEIKARCDDWRPILAALKKLGARRLGILRQLDTYFHVRAGRLKLRQFTKNRGELIFYHRAERTTQRWSNYTIYPVAQPEKLRRFLTLALGVRAIVNKRRLLFLHHNARLHLDTVEGLGRFLEIEVVVKNGPAQARRLMTDLLTALRLAPADFERQSYSDLILARK